MKKFLSKIFVFAIPFVFLLIIFEVLYKPSGGDLIEISFIPFDENYRNVFSKDRKQENKVYNISEFTTQITGNYDVLSIGDSFSNQGAIGYQNYLAHKSNLSILHFDAWNFDVKDYNPIQFLQSILHEDLLDSITVKYVLLEVVEREFVKYFEDLNYYASITIKDLENYKIAKSLKRPKELSYFNKVRLFYKNNFLYLFNDRAFTSNVHVMKLSKKLFSVKQNQLFFFNRDIKNQKKAKIHVLEKINNQLNLISNELNKKNITLIFMICPDKYTMYYDYILDNKYPKSTLFNIFKDINKDYIYIDSKSLLTREIQNNVQDLYFADDTHWSPRASKVIGEEIWNKIKLNIN